jgi:hypothetical protein
MPLQRLGKLGAAQQLDRHLRHFDKTCRDINQPALDVGLPKPVAGIFLKFLEQQRDCLGLMLELKLRAHIVEKQPAVRHHVAGDKHGVDQQENCRHGEFVDPTKQ